MARSGRAGRPDVGGLDRPVGLVRGSVQQPGLVRKDRDLHPVRDAQLHSNLDTRALTVASLRYSADDLLAGGRTLVRGLDPDGLGRALRAAGHQVERSPDGAVTVDAPPERVGRIAAASGQVLLELREGGAGGLEDLFFTLTAPGATGQEQAA